MRLFKIILPLLTFLLWNVTASAQYDPANPPEPGVNFTLTTRSIPAGAAYNITPTATHAFGSNVRLYATPNTGFIFEHWEDENGNIISENRDFSYSMPAKDVILTARFIYNPEDLPEPGTPEFIETANISLNITPQGAGYLYSNGSYWYNFPAEHSIGTDKEFVISANPGAEYRFINWIVDGEIVSEERTLNYLFSKGQHTILANFEYNPDSPKEPGGEPFYRDLKVTISPESAGTAYFSGNNPVAVGSERNVYTYSNNFYTFINWTDDQGNIVSENSNFYYSMPNRNVTLTANYSYYYDPESPGEPGEPLPPGSITENMVAYPRFGMYDDSHVIILCETEGSTIHYTLDGTDPDKSSPVYSQPVYVAGNILVKAIAYKEGMDASPIRSFKVSSYKTAAPVFSFENKKIVISSDTPDAVIRYTLDFSDPNEESEIYKNPIEPEENCRIKAYASKEGLTDSPISFYVYRRAEHTMEAPSFLLNEKGKLVITPSIDGAAIYYSLDGSEPTTESIKYSEPFSLDGNVVIKAFSTHFNYFDSPVAEYVVTGFKVEKPITDFSNPFLNFTTTTSGAQIRYTLNGSIPGEDATLLDGAIRLTGDCKVIARGFKSNYEPSDTVCFIYFYDTFKLPTPSASFTNRKLTLSCEDKLAQIYFTLDGSVPNQNSSLYGAPLDLTNDCMVRFIAVREKFNDSDEGSFSFIRSEHTVEKPTFNYLSDEHKVEILTATDNAKIRYTLDGSEPSLSNGNLYEAAITVIGNVIIKAQAFKDDYFDSQVVTLIIDDQKIPTPTASFKNRVLSLQCADASARIYYSLDGSVPNENSSRYERPLTLSGDCTVRFIAVKENFKNSDEAQFIFRLADYKVTPAVITKNFRARTISINHPNSLQVRITIDGVSNLFSTPATLDVTTAMRSMEIIALAGDNDTYDSDPVIESIIFHYSPIISYDGHTLTISNNPDDPGIENVEKFVVFNDEGKLYDRNDLSIDIDRFGVVKAHSESDLFFKSDDSEMDIDRFNTGRKAGVRNGRRLSETFGTWGDTKEDYEYLYIVGELNNEDLKFLGTLPRLTTLNLAPFSLNEAECDDVFANSRIETISLNFGNEGLLRGMSELTNIFWAKDNEQMPEGLLANTNNPNILLWLTDKNNAPADAKNIVIHELLDEDAATSLDFPDIQGYADYLSFQTGYPYSVHKPIVVGKIEVTKNFNQITEPGICRGWETIALPFTPTSINHERAGEIQPFVLWDGEDDSNKPFWLYHATPSGWEASPSLEAGIPYIISMPNCPDYIETFNLNGNVIFSAENIELGIEDCDPKTEIWINGLKFEATFKNVSGDILSLNTGSDSENGEELQGSVFLPDLPTLPFGGFLSSLGTLKKMPVFDNWSGVILPVLTNSGIIVETIGNGGIRISSEIQTEVDIFSTTGLRVRSVNVSPGESVIIEGLAKGIYFVAGSKIFVN